MNLIGCAENHKNGEIKKVEYGHVLSPWVKCTFRGGGGNEITVGNESSESLNNSAVIKSFNIGMSNGAECKIVIHDTMGSSLSVFIRNMVKELQGEADNFAVVQWGWTKSGCPTPPINSISKPHYLLIRHLETNFIQGKFIHEVTAVDTMSLAYEGGVEKIYGEDGKNAISLKEALRKLFTEGPNPIVKKLKYCRLNKTSGEPECGIGFKVGEMKEDEEGSGIKSREGPKHSWKGNAANKLETARSWLSGWVTDQDKVFVPVYESLTDGGEIIFWERPVFECGEVAEQSTCIGTYIVNGGLDSPVIEFNPRIKWQFAGVPVVGGNAPVNTVEDEKLPQNKAQGNEKCSTQSRKKQEGTGQVLSTPTTDVAKEINGKSATGIQADAQAKQAMQDSITYLESAIMADMTIVGDPTLPSQTDGVVLGKTVAIAFINPFHLMQSNKYCGDWLASPPCNEILSNKNWQILNLNHRIESGTYTTTFQLRCVSPGFDTEIGNPIGNAPDGATVT